MQEIGLCAAQIVFIRLPGSRRLQQGSPDFGAVHMRSEDCDNRADDLVLDHEHVVQLPVVSLGPSMGAGPGIDELRRYADTIAAPPDAPLQYVPRAQLSP